MSIHFEQHLDELKEKLLAMAGHAESALTRAVQALLERDAPLAARVVEDDKILDHYEIEIDELSIVLLAQAPLASHLRFITVAMKASHELERVGDESTTIARRAQKLAEAPALEVALPLSRMAALVGQLLQEALQSFVARTPAKALAVIPLDKEIDRLNRENYEALVAIMSRDADSISRALHWIAISKSLERIGDHATNIAEEVVYLYQGRDVRHLEGLKNGLTFQKRQA